MIGEVIVDAGILVDHTTLVLMGNFVAVGIVGM